MQLMLGQQVAQLHPSSHTIDGWTAAKGVSWTHTMGFPQGICRPLWPWPAHRPRRWGGGFTIPEVASALLHSAALLVRVGA